MGWMDADSLREADTLDFQTKANSLIDDLKQRAAALTQPAQPPAQPFALPSLESLMPWAPRPSTSGTDVVQPSSVSGTAPVQLSSVSGGFSLPSLESLMPWAPKPAPAAAAPLQQSQAITSSAPAIAPSGQPVAMPQGSSVPQAGDLREYARRKAASLGIDPDIAARVGDSEGGFDDPTRQSDVVYQGQREQSYGPYQLNVAGGLGSTALQRGIDPRKPEDVYRAIDLALEHAAQNGWGDFHGAARVGIGPRDGIGGQPTQAAPPAPAPAASGQPAAMPRGGGQFSAGSYTPNQIDAATSAGLDYETALAVCGPAAAIAFARKMGRNPTMQEAVDLAKQVGWTAAQGMAGPASEQQLLQRMGVPAKLREGEPDAAGVAADVQRGNPVIISTPGHYFVAERYDPESGAFDFGASAAVLKASGGRRWFRLDELPSLGMGAPRATLHIDNPESPTPSIASAAQGDMPRLPLAQPEGDPIAAGAEAPTPEPTRYGHFTPSRNEVPLQQAMSGTDTLTSRDYGSIRGQQRDLRTIDGPINVDTSPAVDYVAPGTRNRPVAGQVDEWSPPPVPSTEPYGPVDPSERNRAVRAPDEASYETGGPPPLPDRHTIDGPYPNQFGDRMSYRLPLAATSGPDTAPDAPYDPRTADEGAHEAPAAPATPREAPAAPAEPPAPPQSPLKPVWDAAGAVIGYVRDAATALTTPPEPPSDEEQAQRASVAGMQPGEHLTTPPRPYAPAPEQPGLLEQAGAALQGAGDTVEREGIVRPLVRPISNAIRAAQGRGPLTPETEPVPTIDTAAQETVRSLRSNVGAIGQGIREGNALEAGLGALGTLGDLTPSMLLARQLNEMGPKVDTPLGEIGAGDVVMGAALAHDAARLGYGIVKAGGRVPAWIADAVAAGKPVAEGVAERFGRALGVDAERVAAPGEMQLGSGFVPDSGAPQPGALYHETDPREAVSIATGFMDKRGLNVARDPSFALGQGGKGAVVELTDQGIELRRGRPKPGAAMMEAAGQGTPEYQILSAPHDGSEITRSITFDAGFKRGSLPAQRLRNLGWQEERLADGRVRYSNPRVVDGLSGAPEGEVQYLGSGFIPSRATLANAAQGGVVGAASEDLQAQQEGRDPDPTSRLGRAAVGAALGAGAGRLARGAGRAVRAAEGDAGRVAADAGRTRQGSSTSYGTFGVITGNDFPGVPRGRVIPPHVADTLDFPIRVPEDPHVVRAIEAAGGRVDPQKGVDLYVTRAQGPQAAGATATRGGVFYEAVPRNGRSSFVRSDNDPKGTGGTEVIPPTPTRFRSPLIISDAPGIAQGFDDAMRQIGAMPEHTGAQERYQRAVQAKQEAEQAVSGLQARLDAGHPDLLQRHETATQYDAANAKWQAAAREEMQAERAMYELGTPSSAIDRGIKVARAAGPEGSTARATALKDLVRKYGGDPALIEPLLRVRGADASESAWAIKENILAANARRQGYDGVVTIERGNVDYNELAAHPKVTEAQQALEAADTELERASAAHDAQPNNANWRAFRDADRARVAAGTAAEQAKREAMTELSQRGKITELMDPREAANPTPAPPDEIQARVTGEFQQKLTEAQADWERAAAVAYAPGHTITPDEVAELTAISGRVSEAERVLDAIKGTTSRNPPGYTLRSDIPRRAEPAVATPPSPHAEAYQRLEDAEARMRELNGQPLPLRAGPLAEAQAARREAMRAVQEARTSVDALNGISEPDMVQAAAGGLPEVAPTDRLASVNRVLGQGLMSSVSGGIGAQVNQEQNPDDPNAAAKGFVAGAVGPALLAHGVRGALRLAGKEGEGASGALMALGHVPEAGAPNRAVAVGADPSQQYELRYRVAPLRELITSHTAGGQPNPAFPSELQPRARERAASQLQIDRIARGLVPDALLNDVGRLDSGPMIVGPDNIVESGNGRTLGLLRAADRYPQKYREYLTELQGRLGDYGLTDDALKGVEWPVLVRERVSNVDRPAFAAEANNAGLLRMSSFEQAAQDAGQLSDDAVVNLTVGDNDTISSALKRTDNRGLVRQWVGTLPENERGAVLDANGDLSAQGYDRLTNALLVRTYGEGAGERLARTFIESADPSVRSVQNALMASLPDVARAEALVRSGARDAGLGIGEDVATAVEMLARLRREGVKVADYLGQGSMWERELTPLQEEILRFVDGNVRRPREIRDALKEYAQRVENTADPNQVGMFGAEVAPVSREDLWRGATAGSGVEAPDSLTPLEASAAAGRAPADGPGLAPAVADPVPSSAPSPGLPPARSAPAAVAPARPGPVPEGFAPAGGPEGTLAVEGAPPEPPVHPGPVPQGFAPRGGPEGSLAREGAPPEAPGPVPQGFAPSTGGEAADLTGNGRMLPSDPLREPGPPPVGPLPPRVETAVRQAAQRQQAPGLSPLQWTRQLGSTIGYSSMIGPGTFSVSLISNALEPLYAAPKELARGGVRAIQTGNTAALREPGAMAAGAVTGLGHVGQALWDVIGNRGAYAPNPDMAPLSQRTANPAGRLLTSALEIPGRVWTGVPDAIFGTIAEHAGRAREAAQMATDAGLKGDAWKQRVQTILADAQSVTGGDLAQRAETQQAIDAGKSYADRMSYRDRLGTIGKQVKQATRMGDIPIVSNLIAPFFNTPWNMMLRQGERLPGVGAMMNTQKGFDKAYDQIVGTGLVLGLGSAAAAGYVTGSGPSDPGQRKLLEADGWKPYHTLVSLPGQTPTYVPNRFFGIAESLLNAAGDVHDSAAYRKPTDDARTLSQDALARIGSLVSQQPFAAGYQSIANLASYGPEAFAADQAVRMTPMASTARMIGTALDTQERRPDTGASVTPRQDIAGRYAAGVGNRAGLPVAQDVLGHEQPNRQQGAWAVLPRFSPQAPNAVADAYRGANMTIAQPPSDVQGVALSPDQQRRYQQIMGQQLERMVTPIVTRETWSATPLVAKKAILDGLQGAAQAVAEAKVQAEGGADFSRRLRDATMRDAKGLPPVPYRQQQAGTP